MKYITVLIISILTFAYCTPRISSEITKKDEPPKMETVTVNEISRTSEEFEKGKMIMTQSCKGCHILFDPIDFTVKDWEPILKVMIPKARLTGEDAELVRDYIIAHAKDYVK